MLQKNSQFLNKHPILQEHCNFLLSAKGIAGLYSAKKHFGFSDRDFKVLPVVAKDKS